MDSSMADYNKKTSTTMASVKRKSSTDPFIGRKLGHCEIREKINEGGTAYIYRAFNTSFKLNRVVKILKPALSDEDDFFMRFTQEAQLTARLDHPNILRVFDTGEVDGYFFIEMEYLEGRTLRSLISELNKISERDILNIGIQLVRALNYAHNVRIKSPSGEMIHGILHRDIKPENIMISSDKTVKLMDFGAAKPLNLTSNTMQGMIVGTFHYMSPEQLDGKKLDPRSDFFSMGIVLYELFTGQKPFSSDKLVTLISTIKSVRYKPLRKARPAISMLTEELIDKLLSKKPGDRPQTAKEIDEMIQICKQAYTAWGSGKRVRVPFSLKRFFPTLSLVLSLAACGLSVFTYMQIPKIEKKANALLVKGASTSMLDKARDAENKSLWNEAVSIYEIVPPVEDGGVSNEYLEAQIRRARICFTHLNQLTKAQAILEKLRMDYSDPTIDAYLGQIYFKRALYNEAIERLDAAISSKKGSVIQQDVGLKRMLLYYYANSLDRQYIYIEQDPALLREAIKAWSYYSEFSACDERNNRKDKDCVFARNRLKELEKIDKKESR